MPRSEPMSSVERVITARTPGADDGGRADFRIHTHPRREICFAVEGTCRYLLAGKVYEAAPGTVIMIDSWEPHAFGYRREDGGLRHFWLHFPGQEEQLSAVLLRVAPGGEYRMERSPVVLPPDYRHILERRWDALDRGGDFSPETAEAYMRRPLEAALDEIGFRLEHGEPDGEAPAERLSVTESLKKYIRMSNARGCSLAHLEKIFGYSRYHLAHRFRAEAGCTVGEYIDRVRLEFTEQALKRGLKQKEIAYELGFSSPANFWNWRQRHRGPAA